MSATGKLISLCFGPGTYGFGSDPRHGREGQNRRRRTRGLAFPDNAPRKFFVLPFSSALAAEVRFRYSTPFDDSKVLQPMENSIDISIPTSLKRQRASEFPNRPIFPNKGFERIPCFSLF